MSQILLLDPELGQPLHPATNVHPLPCASRTAIPELCIATFDCPQCLAKPGQPCFYVINGEIGTQMRGCHYRRLAAMCPDFMEDLST